ARTGAVPLDHWGPKQTAITVRCGAQRDPEIGTTVTFAARTPASVRRRAGAGGAVAGVARASTRALHRSCRHRPRTLPRRLHPGFPRQYPPVLAPDRAQTGRQAA